MTALREPSDEPTIVDLAHPSICSIGGHEWQVFTRERGRAQGVAYLRISAKRLQISAEAMRLLGNPKRVEIFVELHERRLAVRATSDASAGWAVSTANRQVGCGERLSQELPELVGRRLAVAWDGDRLATAAP